MATPSYIEHDIMVNQLGWSDWQVENMTEALFQDILADYALGIERGPNLVITSSPSEVFRSTFLTGVKEDVIQISQGARDTLANLGDAVKTLSKNAPLVIVGFVALALVLYLK